MTPADGPRVALGYAPHIGQHDGILAFSEHLTTALDARPGMSAHLLLRERRGVWRAADSEPSALHEVLTHARSDTLALQYNPFSYGHWGVAPGLLAELHAARRHGGLRRLVLVVHEPYVVLPGMRYTLMGAVQRAQLAALLRMADCVLTTSETYVGLLDRVRADTHAAAIPAGSNMPDRRTARAAARAELGASTQTLVVATFGVTRPQQLVEYVQAAVTAALEDGHEIVLVSLGSAPDPVSLDHPRLLTVRPGPLNGTDLARFLAAADLFLAPYSDGVTTRRTTLMAALQHELCILTTAGDGSPSSLGEPALALVAATDRPAFAARARALACDAEGRARYARAGREVYEHSYAWAAIAERFIDAAR
jgi:glycosyltransferase involved in cell wall biosynthesis